MALNTLKKCYMVEYAALQAVTQEIVTNILHERHSDNKLAAISTGG